MRTVGIVCEYNPLHLGHARQLTHLRMQDPEAAVVCLMSGLYVRWGNRRCFPGRCGPGRRRWPGRTWCWSRWSP